MLEAMQSGCDILLSKIPATQIISLNENYYFEKGNTQDLAKKMKEKINNLQYIHSYPIENYNWNKVQKLTVAVYNSLLIGQYN